MSDTERQLTEAMSHWVGWGSFYPVVLPLLESRDKRIAELESRIVMLEAAQDQILTPNGAARFNERASASGG